MSNLKIVSFYTSKRQNTYVRSIFENVFKINYYITYLLMVPFIIIIILFKKVYLDVGVDFS